MIVLTSYRSDLVRQHTNIKLDRKLAQVSCQRVTSLPDRQIITTKHVLNFLIFKNFLQKLHNKHTVKQFCFLLATATSHND